MSSGIVYNIQRMSGQDGPGLRTTVFLKGCPLHCLWCSNPESQRSAPQLMFFSKFCVGCGDCKQVCPNNAIYHSDDNKFCTDRAKCNDCGACVVACKHKAREISGKLMSVDEVLYVVDKDAIFYRNSGGGVTFCGGEPTMAGDFLIDLMDGCQNKGYHVCLDTCGYCSEEKFKAIVQKSDLVLYDIKHMDPVIHQQLTGVDNSLILNNLCMLLENKVPVRIRIPLMPNINDTVNNISALADFLREYGLTTVDILPCHTYGNSKYEALDISPPLLKPYSPEALRDVLSRFRQYNLQPVLVK